MVVMTLEQLEMVIRTFGNPRTITVELDSIRYYRVVESLDANIRNYAIGQTACTQPHKRICFRGCNIIFKNTDS